MKNKNEVASHQALRQGKNWWDINVYTEGLRVIYQQGAGYLYHKRFNTLDMAGMGQIGVHVHLGHDDQYGNTTCLW